MEPQRIISFPVFHCTSESDDEIYRTGLIKTVLKFKKNKLLQDPKFVRSKCEYIFGTHSSKHFVGNSLSNENAKQTIFYSSLPLKQLGKEGHSSPIIDKHRTVQGEPD